MTTNKKLILLFVGLIVLGAVSGFVWKKNQNARLASRTLTSEEISTILIASSTRATTDEQLAQSHEAWNAFTSYLEAAKNHDLTSLKALSYQLSSTCTNPESKTQCEGLMDTVAEVGSLFKESDFTHVLSDEKQIILATDYKKEDYPVLRGYSRGAIYFVRSEDNTLKVLAFGPTEGAYLQKVKGQSDEALESALAIRLEDKDSDGVADFAEECLDPKTTTTCTHTDPTKRDTDGNGWWDSTENFMRSHS